MLMIAFVYDSMKKQQHGIERCSKVKETIRENINTAYSLHDMNVIAFEVTDHDIVMRTQSGMIKTTRPQGQPDGYVEFHDVRWDFSYVYLLDFTGNIGTFTGEKMYLKDFIEKFQIFGFSVMDETYGYNQTKYSGYLKFDRHFYECVIEIYHEGDMIFVDKTEYSGMSEVILSHDSEAMIYSVPAEVAADLEKYCWDFAAYWVWHGPENGKFLKNFGGDQLGAVFGAPDFIEYLNKWEFPERQSKLIRGLGCYDYELPEEYRSYPQYNF